MAHRITKTGILTFSSQGDSGVSSLRLLTFANDKTNGPRVTKTHLNVFANDKTVGPRVTKHYLNAWASLEQGIRLGEPFGGPEVFDPSLTLESNFESPTPPEIEVNPYNSNVENVDQQRILREQHNLIQAGDTTFHWGVLTKVYAAADYNLGSLGRFYHDDFGVIQARFCRFVDFVATESLAVPVGWNAARPDLWTVTNQLEKSSVDLAVGVVLNYSEDLTSGTWYGWVIVDGLVPAEMEPMIESEPSLFGDEFGWAATGKIGRSIEGNSLGQRFIVASDPAMVPGAFRVNMEVMSLARLRGLIATTMTPQTEALDQLAVRVSKLETASTAAAVTVRELSESHTALAKRVEVESVQMAKTLAAIRRNMPDTDFKTYVDTAIKSEHDFFVAQNTIIQTMASTALNRANEALQAIQSQSTANLQSQIDAVNNAMGDLTTRLIGFTVNIDMDTIAVGQVLVTRDGGLSPGGSPIFLFEPTDYKLSSLEDVDLSVPPTDGQSLVWSNSASKWKAQTVSGGGGGGGGGWQRVLLWDSTVNAPTTNILTSDLSAYNELMVAFTNVVCSASTWRTVDFSDDGGATWLSAGDWGNLQANGTTNPPATGGDTRWYVHSTTHIGPRTCVGMIWGLRMAGTKMFRSNRDASGAWYHTGTPNLARARTDNLVATFNTGRIEFWAR